ncbi:hypothetical protein ACFE04_014511 [Oxalis oulophora]
MVSQDSPSNDPSSNSSMLHQFIISSDSNTSSTSQNLYVQSVHMLGERMSRSMDLFGANNNNTSSQRLSLSLGSHQRMIRSLNPNNTTAVISDTYWVPAAGQTCNNAYNTALHTTCSTSYAAESLRTSRSLKAAQSLLDEFVSLGSVEEIEMFTNIGLASELKLQYCNNNNKHEPLQIRIQKLIALLEEVENRYEKYYNQMEQVVSSFEEIGGGKGAAKSYTALALEAMSRHFGSLKHAIISQINACRLPKSDRRMSLQQLGMIPSKRQALRPIRGLPETSLLILRSWLFEHFLHPYPNDSEKLMLASQTGLSKNQVSNWFINARVRLWKPMIEEMYKEEFADSSEDSNPLMAGGSHQPDD